PGDQRQGNRHNRDQGDNDDQVLRAAGADAPSFDGSLNPRDYLDWEATMNQYFSWIDMSEARRVRFAAFRLTGNALTHWRTIVELLYVRYQPPIETWAEMKVKLREKYVPPTYRQRLIDQWQNITQGNRTVAQYIAAFDDFFVRCGVREESELTLSRF